MGPLKLSHEDLWHITIGEFNDLIAGYRYREFLEAQNRAQVISGILSAQVKNPPSVQDIAGVWDDKTCRTYSKEEFYEIVKKRIAKKKKQA